jgi:hypothetical protein
MTTITRNFEHGGYDILDETRNVIATADSLECAWLIVSGIEGAEVDDKPTRERLAEIARENVLDDLAGLVDDVGDLEGMTTAGLRRLYRRLAAA